MNPLEKYLRELRDIRSTGSAVKETSYYPALVGLLSEIGKTLKPRVRCVLTPKNQGAGIPDIGLFVSRQRFDEAEAFINLLPERGVLEVKGTKDDVAKIAQTEQVAKYLQRYGQVLVTNYRDFLLVSKDAGNLEEYRLAESEAAFWQAAAHPEDALKIHGERFVEYLKRVLLSNAPLEAPADVAWFLASYARDAKARVEAAGQVALDSIRKALEEALGIQFTGEKGEHFFRSTLVQTLFYGVFSAWVLWHKQAKGKNAQFDWRLASHYLRVPILRKLFHEVSEPGQLERLNLPEVLDWTAAALNRVNRAEFFSRFEAEHAVQYFYEPFLEAFDPELRKQLGVWYTPSEIVEYMVARVDTVLREELNLADGLADPNVYVLDPCCGTGAYLVEVLKRIDRTLKERGEEALAAEELKHAAIHRVFGFEILPAPFVVAHLQMGLLLQSLGAPMGKDERAGVYLTNALTGWEPPTGPKQKLLYPELEEERDAAEKVKRNTPILVVLGNPPYNGFAGVAVTEERSLTNAYRTTKRAPAPQGQGLNDLYVRFFRMAERRIVELSRQGVVCFISNYSWLDGLSFTGMRERYLEEFDRVWIDCLNGDKYKTGKLTPAGEPDPSVFSTEWNREGIQVGTGISLLVRKEKHEAVDTVQFRHLWGKRKREELLENLNQNDAQLYEPLEPPLHLGLPFIPMQTEEQYANWQLLTALFPVSFPGVKTSRDDVVVDIDRERLLQRMQQYFDPKISHEEMSRIAPGAMESGARFNAKAVREQLCKRGFLQDKIIRYSYRPFDIRWLYWEPETKLLDEKRSEYFLHVVTSNRWLVSQQKVRREWSTPQVISNIGCLDLMDRGASCFPLFLKPEQKQHSLFDQPSDNGIKPNISEQALAYLGTQHDSASLFFHAVAILHAPAYRTENAGALRQDWPRIPLPANKDLLLASAALGRNVAALLGTETAVAGVTTGAIRAELKVIGAAATADGRPLNREAGDFAVTAGWGHGGKGGITMPGKGKLVTRAYTEAERVAIAQGASELGLTPELALAHLGAEACDVYLNGNAYWRGVPLRVWEYTIGGYQVMKKWLSYREQELLGRALTLDEVREVTNMARRIAAILLLEPALDANYRAVKADCYDWQAANQ